MNTAWFSLAASWAAFGAALGAALGARTLRRLTAPVLIGLLNACAGCGYHANPEYERGPNEALTLPKIAIIPFETTSFRRGLEIKLSRLVADEIRARSPQSPSSASSADWHVTGTIIRADERVLSGDIDDSVRESSFWITCEIVVRDPNTDRIIGTTEFTKYQPFSERAGRFKTDQQAADEVLREIAEATVYWLKGLSGRGLSGQGLRSNPDPKNSQRSDSSEETRARK